MEYQAMLEALALVPTPPESPLKPLVIIETDSQQCIDGLSKYRARWAARNWRKEDGKPVENAHLIQQIGQRLDRMKVGFWKIKGHNDDPWNDLADSLAVRGRNQSKTNVAVSVLFRPFVDGEEKFWAIPRISLNPNSNIHDFWPHLGNKWGRHGEPEDYEIWHGHAPLRTHLCEGLAYEIVPRSSPGRAKPAARRNSIDLTVSPMGGSIIPIPRAADWVPRPLERTDIPTRDIPPQWCARVVFQSTDAPEKEWRGWFTEEDTEYDVEKRAHTSLGILGTWRRASFWRDESGLVIVMANRRKEATLRYSGERDAEILEISIGEDETTLILSRLKAKSNFHLTDHANRPFGLDDFLFGYVTTPGNPPLKLLHGSVPMGKKREPTPKKDNRIAIEVKVGSAISVYSRSGPAAPQGYSRLLSDSVIKHSLVGSHCISSVRAVEDRILVEITPGDPLPWFSEKVCPPLKSADDKLLTNSVGTGGWGVTPPPPMMQTRAAAAKAKAVRILEVLLHNMGTDEVEPIGKATDFSEAIALARRSGKVPQGWNLAGSEKMKNTSLLSVRKARLWQEKGSSQKLRRRNRNSRKPQFSRKN
jgi:ribonuclease HI